MNRRDFLRLGASAAVAAAAPPTALALAAPRRPLQSPKEWAASNRGLRSNTIASVVCDEPDGWLDSAPEAQPLSACAALPAGDAPYKYM
ncbi:MAG: hypothetical protein AAGA68_26675 [Pseudomonadota bacterium]